MVKKDGEVMMKMVKRVYSLYLIATFPPWHGHHLAWEEPGMGGRGDWPAAAAPGFLTISQQFPPQVGSLEWLEWIEWLQTNSAVMLASGGD